MQDGADVVPATLPPATARTAPPAAPPAGVAKLSLPGRRLEGTADELAAAGSRALSCFVAGPENRLAAAAFDRLLQAPGEDVLGVSRMLLIGPSGCGKTHLARGLAEAWHARLGTAANGDEPVAYLTASDFRRQVATAASEHSIDAFRKQLRRCRLLVIDDLSRLAGEDYAVDELTHTLDAIEKSGGLFIGASQKPLAETPLFSRGLAGRLHGGLVLELTPPGPAARQQLLAEALLAFGCSATPAALRLLAEQSATDPRRLIAIALRLRQRVRAGAAIDERLAAELISLDLGRPSPPANEIIATVARYYGLPKAKLTSSSRQKTIVLARAVAIYLIRELTPLSYDQIGRLLGGRDHTTVLHNYRRIERAAPGDRVLRTALDELRRSITASAPV